MNAIIVDTEYTTWPGALESGWSGAGEHREIVQIAAIMVNNDFEELRCWNWFVKPLINPQLSPLFIELTHIDQDQVDQLGTSFQWACNSLLSEASDHSGQIPIICMNADEAVFRENCTLNNMEFPFENEWHRVWPFTAKDPDLINLSSGELHTATDTPLIGHTHNALHDVRSMACWLKWAQNNGRFNNLNQLPQGAPDVDPRSSRISKF